MIGIRKNVPIFLSFGEKKQSFLVSASVEDSLIDYSSGNVDYNLLKNLAGGGGGDERSWLSLYHLSWN